MWTHSIEDVMQSFSCQTPRENQPAKDQESDKQITDQLKGKIFEWNHLSVIRPGFMLMGT